eukprot:467819_1
MAQVSFISDVPPLKYKTEVISWPYKKQNIDSYGIHAILVDIQDETGNVDTISLKLAMMKYDKQYESYLNKNKRHPLYPDIVNYFDEHIESNIHFKYAIGQYGWLTTETDITKALIRIEAKTEWLTERFYAHENIQKYYISTYNITSRDPLQWTDQTLGGQSKGWIEENKFILIEGTKLRDGEDGELLNWLLCRESYFMKQENQANIQLQQRYKNRGVVFRESVDDFLCKQIWKSMRGKITHSNRGTIQDVSFTPPDNFWLYNIKLRFKRMFDNEEFETMNNNNIFIMNIFDLCSFMYFEYFVKMYDQFANPFRVKKGLITEEELESVDTKREAIEIMIKKINLDCKMKYDKKIKNKQRAVLRKVTYYVASNTVKWKRTASSGRTTAYFNVYKCTLLGNDNYNFEGVINDY